MNGVTIVDAVAYLEHLKQDSNASRRLKEKADAIIVLLRSNADLAVDKAIFQLEELGLSESAYCRTEIWDIIGMLESAKQ